MGDAGSLATTGESKGTVKKPTQMQSSSDHRTWTILQMPLVRCVLTPGRSEPARLRICGREPPRGQATGRNSSEETELARGHPNWLQSTCVCVCCQCQCQYLSLHLSLYPCLLYLLCLLSVRFDSIFVRFVSFRSIHSILRFRFVSIFVRFDSRFEFVAVNQYPSVQVSKPCVCVCA